MNKYCMTFALILLHVMLFMRYAKLTHHISSCKIFHKKFVIFMSSNENFKIKFKILKFQKENHLKHKKYLIM